MNLLLYQQMAGFLTCCFPHIKLPSRFPSGGYLSSLSTFYMQLIWKTHFRIPFTAYSDEIAQALPLLPFYPFMNGMYSRSLSCTCLCGRFSASRTRILSPYAPRTPQKFGHNWQKIFSQNQVQKDSESTFYLCETAMILCFVFAMCTFYYIFLKFSSFLLNSTQHFSKTFQIIWFKLPCIHVFSHFSLSFCLYISAEPPFCLLSLQLYAQIGVCETTQAA